MINKQSIILGYHRYGKSRKQLARELGISRKTVSKYLEAHQMEIAQAGQPFEALPSEGLIRPPSYDSSKRKKVVLNEKTAKVIDEYLSQNEKKKGQGKHKQLMKNVDIHEALIKAGHHVGYRTVCRYVQRQQAKSKEVFIRQQYAPGQAVEFDWGEAKLCINGVNKTVMLAVFTSCYSNHRWARLYYRQDTSSFLDSHAQYFDYTGAVQQQVVYDNMRTAVRKFTIKNSDKEPTEDLLKMSCYYHFDYRFCNARKGNEKGHVERSVEYVRRKAFSTLDHFDSLADANLYLLQICEDLNLKPLTGKTVPIQTVFEEELQHMKTAGPAFDSAVLTPLRVDKYSCVKVDTNGYSVPEGYVGRVLEVKIYPDKILVYNTENQFIASHVRENTGHQYFLKLEHYLHTLHTKPGALAGALSLQQADYKFRIIFSLHFSKRPQEFVNILLFLREKGHTVHQFYAAVEQCLTACPHQEVNVDKVKIFLQMKGQKHLTEQAQSPTAASEHSRQIAQFCNRQLQTQQSLILSQ